MKHFYIFCFFSHLLGTLLDSEHLAPRYKKNTQLEPPFSLEEENAFACMCMLLKGVPRTQNWRARLGRGSELCGGLSESSFEMYIQCEGLK